ncbi:MAG: hypothetical protein K2Y12_11100 [Chitinophagaceae bacterium]|jgi:hypothetical protein|nr:hypothetical protein [Chitinophagaceae bacterium]
MHLKNGHLIIDNAIIQQLWGDITHLNWVFYKNKNSIMFCSVEDELFKKLHKTTLSMLKLKNANGDRSLSLQELIIDNDLDNTDRALAYIADDGMKILNVTIL